MHRCDSRPLRQDQIATAGKTDLDSGSMILHTLTRVYDGWDRPVITTVANRDRGLLSDDAQPNTEATTFSQGKVDFTSMARDSPFFRVEAAR